MIMGTEVEYSITWKAIRQIFPQLEVEQSTNIISLLDKALGWLPCGGRFYIDQDYLEFAGPECASIKEAVLYEKVGERIAWQIVQKALGDRLEDVNLLKTSGDFEHWTWTKSCHENYLIPRQLFGHLTEKLEGLLTQLYIAFLVTRPIIAGAGWIFLRSEWPLLSISQRAHLINCTASHYTTGSGRVARALINQRDSHHDAPQEWARLHVIAGDLNRCEWSSFLKLGTTAILLEFLAERFVDEESWAVYAGRLRDIRITNPHGALQLVSIDLSTKFSIPQFEGPAKSSWQVQDIFCETLTRWYESYRKERYGANSECEIVLAKWRETLDVLSRDPRALSGILDWPTRLVGVEGILDEFGVSWQEAEDGTKSEELFGALASFDYRYASLNPEKSLFEIALRAGAISRIISEEEINRAMARPPTKTRAFFRGNAVRMCFSYLNGGTRVKPEDTIPSVVGWFATPPGGIDWNRFVVQLRNRKFDVETLEPWNEYRQHLRALKKFINMLPREVIRP